MSLAQIDGLREKWGRAVERDRPQDAVLALAELEKLEPDEPRWSQRLGEAHRRMGKKREAEEAFVRATLSYVKQGFLPRAIAMAKLVASLNPERADILAKLEPPTKLEPPKPPPPPVPAVAKTAQPAAPPPLPAAAAAQPAPRARVLPPTLTSMKPAPLERAKDSLFDEVRFSDLDGAPSIDISLSDFDVAPLPEMREPSIDRLAAMATFRLFAGLSREALLALSDAADLIELDPGAMVMMRNEPADALYAIIDGTVRVTVPGSHEIRLGEGDVVGEGCLLEEGQRQADVLAETAVMALRIEKKKLDEVTRRHAVIGDALFQLLARRLVTNLMYASPIFTSFEPKVRLELAQMFEIRRAEPDTVLSERGKRSDGLYVLLSGNVEATGDLGPMRIARGSTFGHGSLLGATPSTITIKTASEAVLLRLPAARFTSLAAGYPPVLAHLAETANDLPRASLVPS